MNVDTKEALKRAGTVSGHCQLENVRVRTLDAVLHWPEPAPPYSAATELSATIDRSEQEFVVQLDYKVASRAIEGEQALFDISVGLLLEYKLDESIECGPNDLEAFALLSSTFSAHPYLREIVANSTVRMGLPPLILQVLRSPLSFLPEDEPPKDGSSGSKTTSRTGGSRPAGRSRKTSDSKKS